ncbi:MAG TPA: peptidoglycan-binding domain-containing protein, partial [Nakamurella sp.]
GLFTAQQDLWVLYAGPFDSVAAACPARLASPPDALVKGITEDTKLTYFGCICVTQVAQLPSISPGASGVWVGELQRALRVKLKRSVGDIDGPPSLWGSYTSQTQDAVTQFQSDVGLPATGVVDAATWTALVGASC